MNIILSALVGALVAGAGAGIVWLVGKRLGFTEKGQRIGQFIAIVLAIGAIRVLPIDAWANDLKPEQSVRSEVERAMATNPPFDVIQELYPEQTEEILQTATASMRSGETVTETIARLRPLALNLFYAQATKANDDLTVQLLNFSVKQATFLRSQDPQYCHELLNTPTKISFNPATVFPAAMGNEELALMGAVLRDTFDKPASGLAPLSEEELGPLAERVVAALSDAEYAALEQIDFVFASATTDEQKAASCEFALAMLTDMAAMPNGKGASLFKRSMLAGPG